MPTCAFIFRLDPRSRRSRVRGRGSVRIGWVTTALGCGVLALTGAARAATYVLQATVMDIDGKAAPGIQVAAGAVQKGTLADTLSPDVTGTSDASGKVTLNLTSSASPVGAAVVGEDPGRVHLPADPIPRLAPGTNQISFQLLTMPDSTRMAAGGTAVSKGFFGSIGTGAYPPPAAMSFTLDDSPLSLWRAQAGSPNRPVVVVQGLIVTTEHPTPMQVFDQAFDLIQGLRKQGRDVWLLAFSDPLAPMAAQALAVSDAVRIASSEAGGAKVDVVGLSLGGLAARYALARDEATGGPSSGKVGVFATMDTPHQGANIHVAVQAALWVAGGDQDAPGTNTASRIVNSPGVQNILYQWVGAQHFDQDTCGFPLDSSIKGTSAARDAFMAELTALNGDGYPHQSRNVAVAASGPDPRSQKAGDPIYRLKASLDLGFSSVALCTEDYRARPEDVLPGSLFPAALLPTHFDASQFTIDLTQNFVPTFVPYASALDLRGTATPFVATFAPKSGQLTHGAVPDEATAFLLQQLTVVNP
jgi:hypothetical protein